MTDVLRPSAIADDSGHGGVQILSRPARVRFVADLTVADGGLDLGPDPHDLVAAGLAACTTHDPAALRQAQELGPGRGARRGHAGGRDVRHGPPSGSSARSRWTATWTTPSASG
jgi:hypothetical protein